MKKYQQLFKQIQETIQNETYAVGDFLPSEHDLMEQYQVSRDTVRKALSLLQEEGLIKNPNHSYLSQLDVTYKTP
ncbi:GntR family transcriptional regulator, partial [Streptococcus pneumoniae]|uniref:GntR family transcriptional regulator n=1 Tax=Streptococcus pneumoniae TaxID=1313 RepID=UPI000A7C38A1